MTEALSMGTAVANGLAASAGLVLGAIFYGGLWWTVRRAATVRHPGLWVFASLLLRTGLTLTGFVFAAQGHWQRLLFCLGGFVVARVVVTWSTRTGSEVSHAP